MSQTDAYALCHTQVSIADAGTYLRYVARSTGTGVPGIVVYNSGGDDCQVLPKREVPQLVQIRETARAD